MTEKEIAQIHCKTFEELRNTSAEGQEFWYARDLQIALEYSSWDKFEKVISRAMNACTNSGQTVENHFSQVVKMVDIGSGAKRELEDIKLSRYACYLIVQNGDPSKPVIAIGQTYFAIQTRRQELADDKIFKSLKENEKRLFLRNEMREHNKLLVETAQKAGVETNLDFAVFQNHGYKGLYGGLDAKDIHNLKGLKKSQHILDNMGSTELAANLFRATQTEEKLRRENIQGKIKANKTHYEVGKKVRKTIQELGGIMPEALPTPDEDLKKLENRVKSSQKKLSNHTEQDLKLTYSKTDEVTGEAAGEAAGEVTEQVTEQAKRLLKCMSDKEMKIIEIMSELRLKHRPTLVYDYIQPSLKLGLIELTQPDSLTSPTQSYRITEKGKKLLKEIER